MEQFYFYLIQGRTSSDALRKAKIKFIRSTSYSHPFHWAPFVIIGDTLGVIFRKGVLPILLFIASGVLLYERHGKMRV